MPRSIVALRGSVRSLWFVVLWLLILGIAPHAEVAAQAPIADLAVVRPVFEWFFDQRRLQDEPYGRYRMRDGDTAASHYASLDVAIARAVMGEHLPSSLTERQRSEWIDHLHSFSNPDGTYRDTFRHRQIHCNGMTIRAMSALGGKQRFSASPLYERIDEPQEVAHFFDSIDWGRQWGASHKVSGGLHPFSQSTRVTPEWKAAVFEWLDANVEPNTGWWSRAEQPNTGMQGLGGGAHIWPLYEHLEHEFPYPEKAIDNILAMQLPSGRFGDGGSNYMDLDALYGLKYMSILAPDYRTSDIDAAVEKFGKWLSDDLCNFLASDPTTHNVLGRVSSFGMLQHLAPEKFPDSSGAQWLDYFTADQLYRTAEVETFERGKPTDSTELQDESPGRSRGQ